jgi:hypothetical protein
MPTIQGALDGKWTGWVDFVALVAIGLLAVAAIYFL